VRSAIEAGRWLGKTGAGVALALTALLTVATVSAASTTEVPETGQPTREQVSAAVAKLRMDPNLGVDKTVRKLRWNSPGEPPKSDAGLKWLANAFAWLAGTARALLWVAGILLAGLLGLYIKRFAEARRERSVPLRFSMPTHVQDLDIRPESLPDDIGGTALELWERGEHRAALALLYRGLLSRLAHVHGVRIRDSSTEGDCLAMAVAQLPKTRSAYVERLINAWRKAVYGNIEPTSQELRDLCAAFAAAIDTPPDPAALEHAA
jgi:Domain of unknown function (DUF4129)